MGKPKINLMRTGTWKRVHARNEYDRPLCGTLAYSPHVLKATSRAVTCPSCKVRMS